MKLFDRLIKKNQNKNKDNSKIEEFVVINQDLEKQSIFFAEKSYREQYILSHCEQMLKSSRIMENSKEEYKQVVTILSDIQQIENLPEEQKKCIFETARNISRINSARKKFQNSETFLTDGQFIHMEKYEEEIPGAIVELDKKEKYLSKIKNDMKHLEGEKGTLSYHRKELLGSQENLKHLSVITFGTTIVVIIILIVASSVYGSSTKVGYLVLAFSAGLTAFGIFLKNRWNIYSIRKTDLALNKTIQLLNKVKIKYVNITNEIEYSYEKYRINSCHEFNYLWQLYGKEKNGRERYIRTSRDLEIFSQEFVRKLEQFNIKNSGILLYRIDFISDSEKLKDFCGELHERERMIRKKIDDNLELAQSAKNEITEFVNTYPQYGKETLELINSIDSLDEIC